MKPENIKLLLSLAKETADLYSAKKFYTTFRHFKGNYIKINNFELCIDETFLDELKELILRASNRFEVIAEAHIEEQTKKLIQL